MSLRKFQMPYMTTAQRTAIVPNDMDIIFDTDLKLYFVGDGSTTGGIDIVSFGASDYMLRAWQQDFGSPVLALPFLRDVNFAAGSTLSDGRCQLTLYRINKTISVTGAKFAMSVAGDYTADNYNGIGIYSVSGTTYTLIASTTDDGNIWKGTAFSLQSKDFASGPIEMVPGYYFVAELYNNSAQTTAPGLYTANLIGNAFFSGYVLGGTHKLAGYLSSQTSLPATISASALTSHGSMFGFMLF